MTCLFCKAEIDDDVLICPECGAHIAVYVQKKKVEELEEKSMRIINEAFNGWHFLAVAICISVITALMASVTLDYLGKALTYGIGFISVLIWGSCTAPCIVSTFYTWKCFIIRKKGVDAESVGSLKSYPAFVKTLFKVFLVLLCILACLVVIFIIIALLVKRQLSDMLGGFSEMANSVGAGVVGETLGMVDGWMGTGLAIFIIVTIVSIAAVIGMCVFLIKLFERTAKHYVNLKDALSINQYNDFRRAPFVQLVVSGFLFVALGLAGAIALRWNALVLTANGAYLIFNGFFFRKIEEKEIDNLIVLRAEHDRLEIYQENTKKLEDEEHRRKRREQDELLRAAILSKQESNTANT